MPVTVISDMVSLLLIYDLSVSIKAEIGIAVKEREDHLIAYLQPFKALLVAVRL